MARKPSERRNYREARMELNLTPMLNLVALLIPILLVSVTYIEIANIEAELPGTTGDAPPADQPLGLRLRITDRGYLLAFNGAAPDAQRIPVTRREVSCRPFVGTRPPPVGPNADAAACVSAEERRVFQVYDQEALNRTLVALKRDHPDERGITVSADADVPFEALVQALDASRSYERDTREAPLFDRVMFAPQ